MAATNLVILVADHISRCSFAGNSSCSVGLRSFCFKTVPKDFQEELALHWAVQLERVEVTVVAGNALTAPCWCWDESKEQAAAFLEAWTRSTWQENLVFFSPKSLASGAIMFALDSAAAEILLICRSLSFLIQAIGVSYLDLLPIHFGLSG